MRRRLSYFEKRLLLREESFIRKRDFYKEKTLIRKGTWLQFWLLLAWKHWKKCTPTASCPLHFLQAPCPSVSKIVLMYIKGLMGVNHYQGFRLWSICIHALSHCHRQLVGLQPLFCWLVWLPLPDIVGCSNACDALSIGIVICCLQALAESLKHNKTLAKLDLRRYGFGDAEVQAVFYADWVLEHELFQNLAGNECILVCILSAEFEQ